MKRRFNYSKPRNTTQLINERCFNDIELIIKNRLQTAPQFIENLELEAVLKGHSGCVNSLQFSDNGKLLASASDDYHVILWDPFTHRKVHEVITPHRGNIFSVKFLPKSNDSHVITGAGDNKIYVFDINHTLNGPIWKCTCHCMRVKRLAVAPEVPYMFWSSAEDGNIFQFDLREPHECKGDEKISLINLTSQYGLCAEAKCIAINPRRTELLAVGTNDCFTRCYDRRMLQLQAISHQRPDAMSEHPHNQVPKDCVTYYSPGKYIVLLIQYIVHQFQLNVFLTLKGICGSTKTGQFRRPLHTLHLAQMAENCLLIWAVNRFIYMISIT